jgi:hypothetical protein
MGERYGTPLRGSTTTARPVHLIVQGTNEGSEPLDRLMHVPNAQPPEPSDWEHRPTHPVVHVPYQIAAAWDLRVRAEVEAKRAAAARRKQMQTRTLGDAQVAGRVPRELFQRAKKTPALRTWVRSLEEPVRKYLVDLDVAKETEQDTEGDTEDEEIVFVGRNGSMRDGCKMKKARREGEREEGMIFDAVGDDDESGAFKYSYPYPLFLDSWSCADINF